MPKNTQAIAARQDAQVAKQAKEQIAYSAKAQADRAKLADKGGKRAPQPKAEVTHGVAAAAEGAGTQPHTKQALRDNAKAAAPDGQVKAKNPDGKLVFVDATDPRLYAVIGADGQPTGTYVLFASKGGRDAFAKGEKALRDAKARKLTGAKGQTGKAATVARLAKEVKAKTTRKAATKGVIGGDAAIKVVAKANPYKPGTKAAATFDLFAKSPTVAAFRALVAKSPSSYDAGYIRYSSRDGHITVG